MKTVDLLKDNLTIKCKNCGYEFGKHLHLGGYCPAEDPNTPKYPKVYLLMSKFERGKGNVV